MSNVLKLYHSRVLRNSTIPAGGAGGGIYANTNTAPDIKFSTIESNTASIGGGLYLLSDADIQFCALLSNTAAEKGAKLYVCVAE